MFVLTVVLWIATNRCATLQNAARDEELHAVIVGSREIVRTLDGDAIYAIKAEFIDGKTVVRWEFVVSWSEVVRFKARELCVVKRSAGYEPRPCSL